MATELPILDAVLGTARCLDDVDFPTWELKVCFHFPEVLACSCTLGVFSVLEVVFPSATRKATDKGAQVSEKNIKGRFFC